MTDFRTIAGAAMAACLLAATPLKAGAADDTPLAFDAVYTADVAVVPSGGADRRVRYLDNLDLTADADLGALAGWRGARAHVHVLNNLGARTNDAAGALEGVDNIEVSRAALRLFEAWLEQDFGRGSSLRAGMIDLNAEFNASDVSDVLIAPPFGITSEFAATGPAGPSIFPSTALAARLRLGIGTAGSHVQAGVFNARASTLGDPGGIDTSFRNGVLVVGEGGLALGEGRFTLGGWGYSHRQDSLFSTDGNGDPLRRGVAGAYAGLEGPVGRWGERTLGAMVRGGLSRGGTTPFDLAAQAALKLEPLIAARPDSVVSLGVHYARTSADFRALTAAAGSPPAAGEAGFELTVADRVLPFLTVQPDVQLVLNPGGVAGARPTLVTTLRLTIAAPRD